MTLFELNLFQLLSVITGLAYTVTSLILFHCIMPRWRRVSRIAALCVWLLGLGSGWFGTLMLAEVFRIGPHIEARLLGHVLMLLGLWLGISAQLHLSHFSKIIRSNPHDCD